METSGTNKRLVVGIALCFTVLTFAGYLLFRNAFAREPRSPLDVTRTTMDQLMRGDDACLYDNLLPEEKISMNLDRRRVDEICSKIVFPELKRYNAAGPLMVQQDSMSLSTFAYQPLRDADDTPISFGLEVFQTPTGPKTSLTCCLYQVWMLRYAHRVHRLLVGQEKRQGVVDGLRQDGGYLTSLGVSTFRPPYQDAEPVKIGTLIKHIQQRINQSQQNTRA